MGELKLYTYKERLPKHREKIHCIYKKIGSSLEEKPWKILQCVAIFPGEMEPEKFKEDYFGLVDIENDDRIAKNLISFYFTDENLEELMDEKVEFIQNQEEDEE